MVSKKILQSFYSQKSPSKALYFHQRLPESSIYIFEKVHLGIKYVGMNPVREVLLGTQDIYLQNNTMTITYTKSKMLRKRICIIKAFYLNSRNLIDLIKEIA